MCSFHARVLLVEGRKRQRRGAVTRGGRDASVFDSSQMEPDTEFPGRRAKLTSTEELGAFGTRVVASGRCGWGYLETRAVAVVEWESSLLQKAGILGIMLLLL